MPALPKCREEVHRAFDSIDVKTNNDKPFILYNYSVKRMVIFSCAKNLECLCSGRYTQVFCKALASAIQHLWPSEWTLCTFRVCKTVLQDTDYIQIPVGCHYFPSTCTCLW